MFVYLFKRVACAPKDETIVPEDDSEVEGDEAFDEFEKYFSGTTTPKILLTTQQKPSSRLFDFLKERASGLH